MSYIITSGGTAGHIYPALAVASELTRRGANVLFAGSIGGMEEQLVREAGLLYTAFAARGFNRQKPWTLLTSGLVLARSTGAARRWLAGLDVQAVAAFGGYVSVPVGRAAVRAGLPLLIHEQNSSAGWANKHLARHAAAVALTYEAARAGLAAGKDARVELTGNPVRPVFAALEDPAATATLRREFRRELGLAQDALVLLVFGGSQGARHINQAVVRLAPQLLARPELAVVHLTGRKEFAGVAAALEAALASFQGEPAAAPCKQPGEPEGGGAPAKARWKLLDYCNNMPGAFAAADMVLSRAGASSLAELAVAAKPALLVPFPWATDDHQRKNAVSLVEAGAAQMVLDSELDSPTFAASLLALVDDATLRARMLEAARRLAPANAAARVADLLINLAK